MGSLPTNNPAIATLIESRLITINTAARLLNVSCRNPVSNGPVARPTDILVNKKACPTGISRMRMSRRWKVTVNNIGKNPHDRPFTTAAVSSSGKESVNTSTTKLQGMASPHRYKTFARVFQSVAIRLMPKQVMPPTKKVKASTVPETVRETWYISNIYVG